jgi:hypothetical protein
MSWLITPQQKNKGLLDNYPGSAAAYSLRDLTFLRGGPVVRVRRSSDNTEANFTAAQVSDGSLAAWVGAGNNGFVRTWYDQSGNERHLEQTTNASQLRIVVNGTVEADEGKPALRSPTRSVYLTLSCGWNVAPSNPQLFLVSRLTERYNFNYTGHWVDIGNHVVNVNHFIPGVYQDYFNTNRPLYGTDPNALVFGARYLESFRYSGGAGSVYANGNLIGSNSFTLISPTTLLVGGASSYPATGFLQELIIYSNGSGVNSAAIEANINTHYAIY